MLNPVENQFVNQNYEHLGFKRAYTNSSILSWGGRRAVRVDRILVCEVLSNDKHLGRCLQAACKFRYLPSQYNNTKLSPALFTSEYKMDVLKQGTKRLTWVFKDEQEQLQKRSK